MAIINNNGQSVIVGSSADDWFADNGTGVQTMIGGLGNDVYLVDNVSDLILEYNAKTEGIDTIRINTGVSYDMSTFAANVENLILGSGVSTAGTYIGNALDNLIDGTASPVRLNLVGGAGADTLKGAVGVLGNYADTLDGGTGADIMAGDDGSDIYFVDNVGDKVIEELSKTGFQKGASDTVNSSITYTLATNVENLNLTGTVTGTALDIDALNGTGNVLNNIIVGNAGNNIIVGLDGDDTLDGAAGNDKLDGGAGADSLKGGSGFDTLLGGAGNDILNGSAGSGDLLDGGADDDKITGSGGADTLLGGVGVDTLVGGAGNDKLDGGDGADTLQGGSGFDTLLGGAGNDTLDGSGSTGNDLLDGGADADSITGGNGADTLLGGAGNDTLDGAAGNDKLDGGDGNDWLKSNGGGSDTLLGGGGNDLLAVTNTANDKDLLDGGAGNDILMMAGAGTDVGFGSTTLNGGAGDDTYYLQAAPSAVNALILDTAGNDTVRLVSGTLPTSLNLPQGPDWFASAEAVQSITTELFVYQLGKGLENLIADTAATPKYLIGNELSNLIVGSSSGIGGDVLIGGLGNDTLDGSAGADNLLGGAGNDTYVVSDANETLYEDLNAGTDTVWAYADFKLGRNFENLQLMGSVNGAAATVGGGNDLDNIIIGNTIANRLDGGRGNDKLMGDAGSDTIFGGAGADTLDGGAGSDTLYGGYGNDLYFVDATSDVTIDVFDSDIGDKVVSSANYTLGANIENLDLVAGTANLNGTGNGLDNTITGNDGNNTLDDGRVYNLGADTYGGGGMDTLIGGKGDDIYNVVWDTTSERDLITDTAGIDTLNVFIDSSVTAAPGGKTIALSGALAAIENISVQGTYAAGTGFNITGSAVANNISGSNLADSIEGGAGNDTINGGAEADTIKGGDGDDSLNGGTGTFSDVLEGGLGNDTLIGGNGNDSLDGGAGNDSLSGGNDVDTIKGGDGNDTLDGGAGSFADTLDGGNGDDLLKGGAGFADSLVGGAGNDIYDLTTDTDFNDFVLELAGGGTADQVIASDLSVNLMTLGGTEVIENATVSNTTTAITLTGNSGSNILQLLRKGVGVPATVSIDGGAGNDTYIIGSATGNSNDVQTLAGLTLTDTLGSADMVTVYVDNVTVGGGFEKIVLGVRANGSVSSVTGGSGNESILGNAADNFIDGGTGSDTMDGGLGNDTYVVNDGLNDKLIEALNAGSDTVQFNSTVVGSSYTLATNLENGVIIATQSLSLVGNLLDNALVGGIGNDSLDGGLGSDSLDGGTGNDSMIGGAGNDYFVVDSTGDTVVESVGGGIDTINTSLGTVATGTYFLAPEVDNLVFTGATVTVTGNNLNNIITYSGSGGNSDIIDGFTGADTMDGGNGGDTYKVDNLGDVITDSGASGTDAVQITGLASFNMASNAWNVENLKEMSSDVGGSTTTLVSLFGNDLANVIDFSLDTADNGYLVGGGGADSIVGGTSTLADTLDGGAGNDTLIGGSGDDVFIGGLGADSMAGGAGNDMFIFGTLELGTVDTITDFTHGVSVVTDTIALEGSLFNSLSLPGGFLAGNFTSGAGKTAGADADDFIVYNTTNGNLYYDADGLGGIASIQIATISNLAALSAGDFVILP